MPSIRRTTSRSETWAEAFSHLEPRQLLDGAPTEIIRWHGADIEVRRDSWVVTFDGLLGSAAALQKAGQIAAGLGTQLADVQVIGRGGYARLTLAGDITEADVDRAKSLVPGVVQIEPNIIYHTERVPDDPLFGDQYGHLNAGQPILGVPGLLGADVDATAAWDVTIGSESVIIAVLDTGIDIDHPDLATNIWRNPGEIAGNGIDDDGNGFIDDVSGWDFANGDNDPNDFAGHGTAVSGVIGAVGNNGVGVAGVNWTVSILPIKVFPDFGGGADLANIVAGHDYLTDLITRYGHNIVASNNSYGAFAPAFFSQFFAAEEMAIQRFTNTGATFVAAAGNQANNNDAQFTSFPASYANPEIISVAATDNRDLLANFSNWGLTTVDLGAPGVNVRTTATGGGYGFAIGTSFSSPYVAGAVGLLKAHKPNASQEEIKRALIDGADRITSLQGLVVSGGRLNIANSLRIIDIEGPRVVSIFPGPVSSGVNTINVQFDRDINPAFLSPTFVELRRTSGDDVFDGDDTFLTPFDADDLILIGSTLTIDLTQEFPAGMPVDLYRLTLDADGFRDFNGNYLNGNINPPTPANDEVYEFRLIVSSGPFEPNDALSAGTPVIFNSSGIATFTGASIGDGPNAGLDVDIYRFEVSGPSLVVATVQAQRLPIPSSLDSVLRLFNADGAQLALNDNFDGLDSRVELFLPTGGVFFVGVSGFGNAGYNPLIAASGDPQSTGDYTLAIEIDLAATDTNSYNATLLPVPIPNPGTVTSTITLTDARAIVDVNVRIDIIHGFVGDLQIRLISPQGTTVSLVLNRGADGDDFTGTILDDESPSGIASASPPFTGNFRPEVPLGTFDGQTAAGIWSLRITDVSGLNAGTLVAWGLDVVVANDVFGPFEVNDVIGLSTPTGINGAGTRNLSAFIGDGAFGLRDVDLFSFTAMPGTSLTATLTASGGLNGVLRLFDTAGAELILADPPSSPGASLTFAIVNGGVFYLGVSGGGNTGYSIFSGGSGTRISATGSYTLSVTVTGGISVGGVVLDGNQIDLGLAPDGTIGFTDGATRRGVSLGPTDFIVPQDPAGPFQSLYTATFDGFSFLNDGAGASVELAVALTNQSDARNRRVAVEGLFRGLGFSRTFSYGINDQFIAVDVRLTNTTGATMSTVAWAEAFNPQTGLNRRTTFVRTVNNVQNATGRLVTAAFFDNDFQQGLTIGLGAPVPSGTTTVLTAVQPINSVRDPLQILSNPAPDPDPAGDTGVSADRMIAVAFDVGLLGPGASVSFRYFILTGTSISAVDGLFAALESGAGTGHLESDPANPAIPFSELPFVAYYPEGYANSRASTFVPILNPHSTSTRVVVMARYEVGARDQILADFTIPATTRSGITITTPQLYASGQLLVRPDTPYALEIWSSQPVAANLSHFDFGVSTGESFTTTASTTWTFGEGFKGTGVNDFLVFYNPGPTTIKVSLTIYPEVGAPAFTLPDVEIAGFRRGGFALANIAQIPDGPFGMRLIAEGPIVAALTHFDNNIGGGFGVLGQPNLGSLSGSTPEGQLGINAEQEFVTILNAGNTAASINFTFFFENGSAYRQIVNVPANRRGGFAVGSLPSFPRGEQPYSILYESNVPVTVTLPSFAFGEATGSGFADQARSLWMFADGFRPLAGGQVTEYLRIYNPAPAAFEVAITIAFNDGGTETFRRTINPRSANEFDVHEFVTGDRAINGTVPGIGSFYGLTIRSALPVVAYMGHFDANFFGGFGTLGFGLGNSSDVH
jgi:subtilisin family serine protease/subtilisin-like proprotein convertase family protein